MASLVAARRRRQMPMLPLPADGGDDAVGGDLADGGIAGIGDVDDAVGTDGDILAGLVQSGGRWPLSGIAVVTLDSRRRRRC